MKLKTTSIHEYFGELPDPRNESRRRHLLMDILTISLLAIVGGAEGRLENQNFKHQDLIERFPSCLGVFTHHL